MHVHVHVHACACREALAYLATRAQVHLAAPCPPSGAHGQHLKAQSLDCALSVGSELEAGSVVHYLVHYIVHYIVQRRGLLLVVPREGHYIVHA